jgi:hypothetical protein
MDTETNMTQITITKRTARNTCYTIVEADRNGGRPRKDCMLHAKFEHWMSICPEFIVIDNAK